MAERFLIGVTGGSASGKTEIARAAARAANPLSSVVLAEDDYYGDHGSRPDFRCCGLQLLDHPESRDHALLAEHLAALKAGKNVEAPIYDFSIHRRRDDTRVIDTADVIVVEGIHLFCDQDVCDLFDLRVFVEAPDDVRLARRLLRDVEERGRTAYTVVQQYLRTVRPMHHEWTQPTRGEADLVITNAAAAARPADHLSDFFHDLAAPVAAKIEAFKASRGV